MVAVVVANDLTEAIPLLDDNGSGVYSKGRNTADEFRKLFYGGLFGKIGGSAVAIRNGILAPTAQSGGIWIDGRVTSSGGAGNQTVGVLAFRALCNRANHGPYMLALDAAISVAAPAADGTNARIDLLAAMPYDKGAVPADAQHGPKFIWVTGDPAGSPVVPALPAAVTDALVLAQVTRPANDNTITQADIVQVYSGTSLHGGIRMLQGGDVVGTNGGYHGELRGRTSPYIDAALVARGHGLQLDYYDEVNTKWVTINGPSLIAEVMASSNGTLNTTEQMDSGTQATFNAIAGHKYKILYGLGHTTGADGNQILLTYRYAAGGAVTISSTLIESSRTIRGNIGPSHDDTHNFWTAPTTGQYTIGVGLKMVSGSTGTIYGSGAGNARRMSIWDCEY